MLSDIVRTCKCPQNMHNQHRSPCASYSTAHCSTPPPRRTPPRKAASDSWQRQHRASTSTTRASSIGAVVDVAEAIRRRRVEKVSCVALTRPREGRRALAESRHGKSHQILAVCGTGIESQKSEHVLRREISSATTPSVVFIGLGEACEHQVGRQKPPHVNRHAPVHGTCTSHAHNRMSLLL